LHAGGRRFGLGQIARGAHHVSAMSDERTRRLDAEAGGHACHQDALAAQVHTL
jgi:hypothetical protein